MAERLVTPECVLSYPNLFEPRSFEGGPLRFSATLVFLSGVNIAPLKQAALAVLEERWGSKVKAMLENQQLRLPFRPGAQKNYPEGSIFMNVSSQQRPGVVDQKVQPIIDPSEIYAGCIIRASIRPFAYDKAGNKGVSFGLINLQKLRDGERLDSRTRPDEDFDPVDGGVGEDADAAKALADLLS